MANCCVVDCAITFMNKEDYEKAKAAFNEAIESSSETGMFNGNIESLLNYTGKNTEGISRRCTIAYFMFEDDKNTLELSMDCSWCPHFEPICFFFNYVLGGEGSECDSRLYDMVYTACEPNEGIYESNDPQVVDKYTVYAEAEELEEFCEKYDMSSAEELKRGLEELLGYSGTVDDLIKDIMEKSDDNDWYLSINKYEYMPISEWGV